MKRLTTPECARYTNDIAESPAILERVAQAKQYTVYPVNRIGIVQIDTQHVFTPFLIFDLFERERELELKLKL